MSVFVRCWCCKREVPEESTVCQAGVGTRCKDSEACEREREDGIPTPRVSVLLVPSLGGMTALEDALAARYDEATKLAFDELARWIDPPITLDEAEVEIGRAIVEAVSPLVSNLPKPEVYVRRNRDNPETIDVTIKVRPLGWAKAEEEG